MATPGTDRIAICPTEQSRQPEVHTMSDTDMGSTAGKYLTFQLGRESFGLEILKVQEIIGMMPITRVPRTPAFVRGVINLRGKVIPVVDLRVKLGFEAHDDSDRRCIIVALISRGATQVTTGLLVDEVSEVLDITRAVDTECIPRMGRVDSRVVMLVDVDRVLASDEITSVERLGEDSALGNLPAIDKGDQR
jgi:purine-binding chemotaxis protein CheW